MEVSGREARRVPLTTRPVDKTKLKGETQLIRGLRIGVRVPGCSKVNITLSVS